MSAKYTQATCGSMWGILEQMRDEGILPLGRINAWSIYYALRQIPNSRYPNIFPEEAVVQALHWAYQRGISGGILRDWVAEWARRENAKRLMVLPVRCVWGCKCEVVNLEIFNIRDFKDLPANMTMALRLAHPEAPLSFPQKPLTLRITDVPDVSITFTWAGEVRKGKFRPVRVWANGGFAANFCGPQATDVSISVQNLRLAGKAPNELKPWQLILRHLFM